MPKRQQSLADLQRQYREQLAFLETSCRAFDAGTTSEAKRLAVTIRLLVRSSKQSTSLLSQLDMADLLFFDTAQEINPANLLPTIGLLMVRMSGGTASYTIPPPNITVPWPIHLVPLNEWWNKTVVISPAEGIQLSRRDLVLTMAEQDGGAHVDPNIEEPYYRVSREHAVSGTIDTPLGRQPLLDVERASVRQIAQEVRATLQMKQRSEVRQQPG